MKSYLVTTLFVFFSLAALAAPTAASIAASVTAPNLSITPGVLCTASDPDFKGKDYPEQIARCNRNIPAAEKVKVAALYGNIPQAQWPQYEFDHLIPLCAGGSDDMRNLWPQPIAQAHEKDKLEVQICTAMKAGTMTQAIAVKKVYDWFKGLNPNPVIPQPVVTPTSADTRAVTCMSDQIPALVAKFKVVDDTTLEEIVLSLNDGADHEVISAQGQTAGVSSRAKTGPLARLLRYSITSPDGQDRFDLYTPTALSSARQAAFTVFAKISFEGTYPGLNTLSCTYDVP